MRFWWVRVMRVTSIGLIGCWGGMKHGGRSALYGWQSSTSIAEVSGFLPRHAMWGSDGRVKWKERRAHCSLADGKGKMKSVCVHPLSLSRPFSYLFVYIPYALTFLSLLLLISQIGRICGLVGRHHTSTEHCRAAARTTEASFLSHCFHRMWDRPPVISERQILANEISRCQQSPQPLSD